MKWIIRLCFTLLFSLLLAGLAGADAPPPARKAVKYARGYKAPSPAVLAARHTAAYKRHGLRVKWLPKATPATYDLRTLNRTGPIQDQAQCGSCWDVSACGVVTDAFIASGQFSSTDASLTLSPQYVLDCGQNGGCNGDDAPTVLDMARSKGLPTTADYGPYIAAPQQCKYTNQKLYQLADWGFCTPAQQMGTASTQDVKNCLVQYGTISTAVSADGWDSIGADGVIPYSTSTNIDHDVAIVGWDDGKQIPGAPMAGAWIVKNQWGQGWGSSGYAWVAYGSHQIGTEAAWTTAGQLPPPPPPPPGPVPGAPTLTTVLATFSDGSTQTLGGPPQGLTAAQLSTMTIQQISDYINKGKAKPPAPPKPAPPPMPPAKPASSTDGIVRALEGLEKRLTDRIDRRLDSIENRVRKLEDRSISIPASAPVVAPPAPPPRWTPEQIRSFDRIRKNLDDSLKRQGKGVMRSERGTRNRTNSGRSINSAAVPVTQGTAEETYADAYRRALRLGLPLLVWVGGEFCPS